MSATNADNEVLDNQSPSEIGAAETASPGPDQAPAAGLENSVGVTVEKPKPTNRLRGLFWNVMRWGLGILIVVGVGVLLAIFTLYRPVKDQLSVANDELRQANSQIAELNQQITELNRQIDSLKSLEEKNKALETTADLAALHAAILSARTDVSQAQLALAKNETARARVALSKTGDTLDKIENQLPAGQGEVVADMRARLELALDELEENTYAAESDLDVLATSLLELENAIFSKP